MAWKAYKIGNGHSIPSKTWSPEKQSIATLTVQDGSIIPTRLQISWKKISINAPENICDASNNAQAHDHNHEQDDTQEEGHEARDYAPLYYCPEEGYTSAFTRYHDLMKHMENGRHH